MDFTPHKTEFLGLLDRLKNSGFVRTQSVLWALRLFTMRRLLQNEALYKLLGFESPAAPPQINSIHELQRLAEQFRQPYQARLLFFGTELVLEEPRRWEDVIHYWHRMDARVDNLQELEIQGHEVFQLALSQLLPNGEISVTSTQTANLIASLICQDSQEHLFDPACGVGNQLIACAREVRGQGVQQPMLFGQDINPNLLEWATIHCILLGFSRFQFAQGDALVQPQFEIAKSLRQFDVVVNDPPFGKIDSLNRHTLDHDGYHRFWLQGGQSNLEWAFVQHGFASLNEHGRMAILMNPGTLIRSGVERDLRKHLVEMDWLEAVIALPPGSWTSATKLPGFILIISRQKRQILRDQVVMIDVSDLNETSKTKKFEGKTAYVTTAEQAFKTLNGEPSRVLLVSREQIEQQDYSLQPSTYLRVKKILPKVDLLELREELQVLEMQVEQSQVAFNRALDVIRNHQKASETD